MMKLKIIKSLQEFKNIKQDWEYILQKSLNKNLFLTFDWILAWLEHFGSKHNLLTIIVEKNDKPIAIAPLFIENKKKNLFFNHKTIKFIGDGISDYAGIICCHGIEEEVYPEIFKYLFSIKKEWDNILMNEINEKDSLINFAKNNDYFILNKSSICPSIIIDSEWEDYYSKINKKLRKELKWLENKLTKTKKHQFIINTDKISSEDLYKMFEINKNRLKSKDKKGWYEHKNFYNFIEYTTSYFTNTAKPAISLIKIENEIAAYSIGYIYDSSFYYWNVSINNKFKSFSPGKMLFKKIIEDSVTRFGIKHIDLLRGQEDYKYRWINQQYTNYSIKIQK